MFMKYHVSGTVLTTFSPYNAPNEVGTVVIPVFQMTELRHTEAKKPA